MAGTQPVAVYSLRIPPGDVLVPAVPEFAAMVSFMHVVRPTKLETDLMLVPIDDGCN